MLSERDYMRTAVPPEPIRLTPLQAVQMIMRGVGACTADELQDLINENVAFLGDDDNGTYEVIWGEAVGRLE